jgi:glycosyltransferase involved in cell wall biosynthesis
VHVEEVRRALVAAGHDVVLLARRVDRAPPGSAVVRVRTLPGRLRRPGRRLDAARLRRAVAAEIARRRPDFLYERYSLGTPEPGDAARAAGVPVVLEVNAPLVEEAARFRGGAAPPSALAAERARWRAADLVVVVSEPLAESVRATGQRNVLVAPNAVDADLFRPMDGDRTGLDGRFVVAFAGTVRPWHDMVVVLDALRLLPNATLLLVGDATRLPDATGVHVVRTGPVAHAEVPRLLAAADVCVAPLAGEHTYFSPLKAMEYLACGRATVVAYADGLAPLADAGAAAAYRPGSATDLARVLAGLAADPAARERLAARGREHATAFSWHDVAARVVAAVAPGAYQVAAPRL